MSSTTHITRVEDKDYTVINDVIKADYIFTDGCGYISQYLMEIVEENF
jgi:hypothetical protein